MNRTDLADPGAGILASLERNLPLAIFEHAGTGADARLEVEAEPGEACVELDGPLTGSWQVRAARIRGALTAGDGSSTRLDAIGAITEAAAPGGGPDTAALRRSLVICFEEGEILALSYARGAGSSSHGEEEARAAFAAPGREPVRFATPLLSTEYGPDGLQRRATLELWPDGDDGGPLRGGGTTLASVTLELPGAKSRLAFFEWMVDGRPGIGRYEIISKT